ncbi:Transcription factor spt20, variant 2 [Basidiobolus ranarum]|uniref:Transcription factor spt20, variant 2 n=1 Tax=Basidiobolus ranarum TaxID=34480 RepID=A0ABR2X483_9FUNG
MRVDQVDSGSTTLAQTEPEKWELNGVKQWTSLNAEKPADPPVSLDVKKQKEILERHKDSPPSFVLHIFPTHFKFEKQDGVFLFSSSMKNFLDYLNKQRIPPDLVDVFDEAQCQYYEGCIIAEIHDYREIHLADIHASNANTHRVLLTPNAETLWSDLCLLNEKCDSFWSEDFTLEVESKILLATEEPLCLDPSFQVTRISNTMCNYGNIRKVKKRKKRISVEKETESAEKAEKEKTMMMMDERYQREFQPTFGRLSFVQDWRKRKTMADAEPSQGLVTKKLKNRQIIEPLPPTHDNKQIVRTLRFAKEAGGHTLYTIINIYLDGNTSEFDGLLRIGAAPNTSINGNTMKFHIGSKSTLQMYIENAKRIFEIDHKLISDDSLIAFSSPAPSPSLQASTQDQQPEPTSSQSPHLLSHVQNPLLMLAQTQPIARTLPQAIPSVQQPPQPAPLPQPPIQISPTQPQTTPSLPAQLPTQLPSHLDSSSSQPQHSPLQAHLFQAQQASASPPVGGNLQTPAILPGNITPANTNGIPSTSTSSATPQDALSLSLQQFAQSKGMKNLTPQQLNQLKQQLIRKKQLMMQRALQQQQQQRQQAQQTQQQSPLLSVPSPQNQQQQFSPSQQQLQSPHQQHSQLSSPIQFSQNSSPMLQRQEMGQSPSISNQQMSISPQQHQQSPPQPSLSVAQASLQFRTSPLQPPPPQQMLQVRPTGNVPHQMTSPNGQPVNLPNGSK